MDQIAANLLRAALVAAQKVEKKFRQLRNRDEVSHVELEAVKRIVEDYRALCDHFGVARPDIDSGAEREKRR